MLSKKWSFIERIWFFNKWSWKSLGRLQKKNKRRQQRIFRFYKKWRSISCWDDFYWKSGELFCKFIEDVRHKRLLNLSLQLTDPDVLKQTGFMNHGLNVKRNPALEKIQSS